MKRLFLAVLLLALTVACSGVAADGVTLLFTTDIHSNAVPRTALIDGKPQLVGGFARLKTAIDANGADGKAIVLDSGDFSMTALYQSFTQSDAFELTLMDEIGYDATALGNHDFEVGAEGLKLEFEKLRDNGCDIEILCSNLVAKGKSASSDPLDNPLGDLGVKNYTVVERNGLRVGVFSLMGKDAARYAPTEPLTFADCVQTAKTCVKALREKEKVDLVVLLSHAGILPDGGFTEDIDIAKAVDGIDVILSGHMHVALDEIVEVNDTVIVCAGTALAYLGRLDVSRDDKGWEFDYRLIPLGGEWAQDESVKSRLDVYTRRLNDEYLKAYDVDSGLNDVFAYSPYSFPDGAQMAEKLDNYALGALINDAYLYTLDKLGVKDVCASMIPIGVVRAGLYEGELTVMDAYNVLSYGVSPIDGSCGSPIMTFYLNGRELYDLCETSVSVSEIMNSAQLLMGGVRYTYASSRPFLDKVYRVEIRNPDTGEFEPVGRDESVLYKVACSWTSMQSISLVQSSSYGLLSIIPKDENGSPLDTEEKRTARIVREANGQELKEWYALYAYIADMPRGENGLATIDERYGQKARFMLEDNGGFFTFFVNPSKAALIMLAAICAAAALITFAVVFTARRKSRKKSI